MYILLAYNVMESCGGDKTMGSVGKSSGCTDRLLTERSYIFATKSCY